MKQKKYLFIVAAAALFAACSSDDSFTPEKQQASAQQAVEFSAYVNRGTTRAGAKGELTTTSIQTSEFGVFGYYTDNQMYSQTSIPNFMYNQQVTYSSGWTYDPLKYWPNEYGKKAVSDGEDRLTFFAYAPYVVVNPGTGRIDDEFYDAITGYSNKNTGIVGLTSNVSPGDPYVKYYVDFDPAKQVDLCWGVAKSKFTSTVDGPTANNIDAGNTYVDVIKPAIDAKIDFDFKHALAWLNVQIDAIVDKVAPTSGEEVDGNTKIYVRSVTFEGFATKGLLNLHTDGDEPQWYELSSANTKLSSAVTTIYDGRRDGKEGQDNATASNEVPSGLNPIIVQSATGATAGVTKTPVNLFYDQTTATSPIYVIPTDENVKVTIVYDVETKDKNVAGYLSDGKTHGSTIENKITQDISWAVGSEPAPMKAGKKYTVYLHLGMNSVKVDASVTPWTSGDAANVDLPANK